MQTCAPLTKLAALLVAATIGLWTPSSWAKNGEVQFEIPAQPLDAALLMFSEQANMNLVGLSSSLSAFTSKPITGTMAPLDALQQLLEDTGLTFDIGAKGSVIIRAPAQVHVQEVTEAPEPDTAIEEIVVTNIRRSLESALEMKMAARVISDGISAEDLGKFPDANVAESLQRITGIAISRGRGGEGLFVTVRGLDQQFNLVTINNRVLATDSIGREFSFDVLPSEIISGAQVYKTPMALHQEGSVGGTINMNTARPLDNPGFNGFFSVGSLYDDSSERWGEQLSGFVSNTTADGRFGWVLGAAHSRRLWRADMAQSLGFAFSDIDLDQDGTIDPATESGLHRPGFLAYPLKTGERKRLGLIGTLQYQPSDHLKTSLDLLYLDYDTPEQATYQTNNLFQPFRPGSVEVDDNKTITGFIIDDYVTEVAIDPKNRQVDLYQIGWNTEWQATSALTLAADIAYSSISRPEGGKNKFWVAGIPGASAEFSAASPVPSLAITLADGRDLSQATNDDMHVHFMESKGDDIEDEILALRLDASLQTRIGHITSLNYGIGYTTRSKDKRTFANDACAYCGYPFSFGETGLQGLDPFPYNDFLRGVPGTFPRVWPVLDADAVFAILQAADGVIINPDSGMPYTPGYSARLLPRENPRSSSLIEEDIVSAYLQINFEGDSWHGNLGARLSRTGLRSSGAQQSILGLEPIPGTANSRLIVSDLEPVTLKNSYTNWLPSANLTLELRDDLLLRLAAAKTLSRPSLAQLGVDVDIETNIGVRRVSENGNPHLEPITAWQGDASLEWYPSDSSSMAAALFYKDVRGFVTDVTSTEVIIGEQFTVTRPTNHKRAKVTGIELALQHLFENGLGFQLNYTYSDSSTAENPSQQTGTGLENLSRFSYNIIGIYEKGRVSSRIAFNYRDSYTLTTIGQGGRPETTDKYVQLDFRTDMSIHDNLSLYIEGLNLTAEALHIYSEYENRLIEYEQIGRRFSAGIRMTF